MAEKETRRTRYILVISPDFSKKYLTGQSNFAYFNIKKAIEKNGDIMMCFRHQPRCREIETTQIRSREAIDHVVFVRDFTKEPHDSECEKLKRLAEQFIRSAYSLEEKAPEMTVSSERVAA